MSKERELLMYAYADLDIPIQWVDTEVEAWAKKYSIATRRDCLGKTDSFEGFSYFNMNTSLKKFPELRLFSDLIAIPPFMFRGCSNLTQIELPGDALSLGRYVFDQCNSLTSIDIPNGVISIEKYAFRGCSNLTQVKLPSRLESIGNSAFLDCSSLSSVKLPDRLKSIGEFSFSYCFGLTSIELPDSLTSIGGYAFDHCTNLIQIELPGGLNSIGSGIFSCCNSLTIVKVSSKTPPPVNKDGVDIFDNCPKLATIYVPDESLETYKKADGWSSHSSILKPLSEWVDK